MVAVGGRRREERHKKQGECVLCVDFGFGSTYSKRHHLSFLKMEKSLGSQLWWSFAAGTTTFTSCVVKNEAQIKVVCPSAVIGSRLAIALHYLGAPSSTPPHRFSAAALAAAASAGRS